MHANIYAVVAGWLATIVRNAARLGINADVVLVLGPVHEVL